MIDLTGRFIRGYERFILPNAWVNKDIYRAKAHELCVIHAMCIISLEAGAETISSIIVVSDGGLHYYHGSKIGYAVNVEHTIVTPILFREGEVLRVQFWASGADIPATVTFRGMSYDTREGKET